MKFNISGLLLGGETSTSTLLELRLPVSLSKDGNDLEENVLGSWRL